MSEPRYLKHPEVPEWIVEKCAVPPQAVDLESLLPEEIVFNWRLSKEKYSCLFIVTIRDSTCLLKVVSSCLCDIYESSDTRSIMGAGQKSLLSHPVTTQIHVPAKLMRIGDLRNMGSAEKASRLASTARLIILTRGFICLISNHS